MSSTHETVMGRHRRGKHAALRRTPSSAIPTALAGTTVALVIALAATGGTYATWNKSQALSSATLKAGTASLTLTTISALPSAGLYPGQSSYGSYSVTNTGDTALTLTVASLTAPPTQNAYSQAIAIGVATATTSANCLAGTVSSPWWTGTFAAQVPGGVSAVAVPKGGSVVLCLRVSLPGSAANGMQGMTASGFGVTVGGVQS